MDGDSAEFSDDGMDDFENSLNDNDYKKGGADGARKPNMLKNNPYDEDYEVSQDPSVAESYDNHNKPLGQMKGKEKMLKNHMYDEEIEMSQSFDNVNMAAALSKPAPSNTAGAKPDAKGSNNPVGRDSRDSKDAPSLSRNTEQTKSQQVLNRAHDEEMSVSNDSDESMDTARDKRKTNKQAQLATVNTGSTGTAVSGKPAASAYPSNPTPTSVPSMTMTAMMRESNKSHEDSDEEGDPEESYEHIEGAYNARDFANLNVPADVRDLFQYIERYKAQEVELDTPLKCFIPEYIPAIGELDGFLKIPRPDGREDGTGLKFLDEPASNQSDPTVLELNLRAKSKKLQYSDMVVRSIENADKNPQKVDKWIFDINELHRNKPPVQVNYKKNMPEIDKLMEVWPPEVEALLNGTMYGGSGGGSGGSFILPSPDLEMTLMEYVRTLCALVDIPVYDNPVESLHVLFTLYVEFKNNPHFQDRFPDFVNNTADAKDGGNKGSNDSKRGAKYGGADVLEITGEDYA